MLADGAEVWARLARAELQKLELREGQIVYLGPGDKSFSGDSPSPKGEWWGLDSPPRTGEATQRYLPRLKRRRGGVRFPVAPRPDAAAFDYAPSTPRFGGDKSIEHKILLFAVILYV